MEPLLQMESNIIIPTDYSIRGFPLEMHITKEPDLEAEDPARQFYIWNRIPLRINNRRSYRSEFATTLRKIKQLEFAYLKIRIDLRKPLPIYIQEFFVYSNILQNNAAADELSKGLGKKMLCASFTYMLQQRWMRTIQLQGRDTVYLKAGGGQAHQKDIERVNAMPWEECLFLLKSHHETLILLLTILLGENEPTDIMQFIAESTTLPTTFMDQVQEIEEEERETRDEKIKDETEDEDIAYEEYQTELAFRISLLFENFPVEIMLDFIMELNENHPELDIPERIRYQLVVVQDNLVLANYYKVNYGFKTVEDTNGESIRMETSVQKILEGCRGKKFQGRSSRKMKFTRPTKNSVPRRR